MKYPKGLLDNIALELCPNTEVCLECKALARRALGAVIAALPAAGCKIVVAEATPEMCYRGDSSLPVDTSDGDYRAGETCFAEMFDAAPLVPEAWQEKERSA